MTQPSEPNPNESPTSSASSGLKSDFAASTPLVSPTNLLWEDAKPVRPWLRTLATGLASLAALLALGFGSYFTVRHLIRDNGVAAPANPQPVIAVPVPTTDAEFLEAPPITPEITPETDELVTPPSSTAPNGVLEAPLEPTPAPTEAAAFVVPTPEEAASSPTEEPIPAPEPSQDIESALEPTPEQLARLEQLWKQGAEAKHRGDHTAARRYWQEALELRPGHPGFQDAIDKLRLGY